MSEFRFAEARSLLERTPAVLDTLLRDLPPQFISGNEGPETWSPFDIVGHLAHGERTDWVPRVKHLLEHGENVVFPPLDRFAQFTESEGKSINDLLDEFRVLRGSSLKEIDGLQLGETDMERTGLHPAFGRVTLSQLLATWVTHDLDHLMQISRCLARHQAEAVGPWKEYLRVVRGPAA